MAYHVFFDLSSGLSKPLRVPKGITAAIWGHIEGVEAALPLKREQWKNRLPAGIGCTGDASCPMSTTNSCALR